MPANRGGLGVPALAFIVLCLFMPAVPANGAPAREGAGVLPPSGLEAWDRPDDAGGMVELSWEPSPSADIRYYRVYRAEAAEGPFVLSGEHSTESFVNYLGWVDTGLEDGRAYYYRVTAVDARGAESDPSPAARAVPSAQLFQAAFQVNKSIVISLAQQRLYCVENNRTAMVFRCSTGAGSNATPPGNYRVLYHAEAMPIARYPGCVCYHWLGFAPDYGIHGWPTNNGVTGDTSAIGTPASHGCVRLLPDEAPIVFYWAPDGIPVKIISGSYVEPPGPISGGTDSLGAVEPSTTWYFAEGYTGEAFDVYLPILNPQAVPATVTVDYMLPDGSALQGVYAVAPMSRFTVHIDEVPGLEATDVSFRVTSDHPVVAERATYFDYHGITGGHAAVGAVDTSTTWYFAEGYTGQSFDEYLCLFNPGDDQTLVNLSFQRDDGTTIAASCPLPARSRRTVKVDDIPGLEDADNSVVLTADRGFVAERAMYFDYNGVAPGGSCTLGSGVLATRWELAEGYTGGGFDEFVLIQNPGGAACTATVRFFKEGGSVVDRSYQLLPFSRHTIKVDDVPGCESASVSVQVDGGGVPLMVERAMYFNQEYREGGHASIGARSPSTTWYFAEGYTAASFDTYLLLENPDPILVAHVNLALVPPGIGPTDYSLKVPPRSRVTVHADEIEGFEGIEFSTIVTSDLPVVAERAVYFCILR